METIELNRMSIDELRNLNSLVISVIESKKRILSAQKKRELYVGAKVRVDHDKLRDEDCFIEKINRTKCVIGVEGRFDSYNVPISMLTLKVK